MIETGFVWVGLEDISGSVFPSERRQQLLPEDDVYLQLRMKQVLKMDGIDKKTKV